MLELIKSTKIHSYKIKTEFVFLKALIYSVEQYEKSAQNKFW